MQATALVHEAYLRLIEQHSVDWRNRAHFFGLASEMMRWILVNYAESRNAKKRGEYAKTEENFRRVVELSEELLKKDPKISTSIWRACASSKSTPRLFCNRGKAR